MGSAGFTRSWRRWAWAACVACTTLAVPARAQDVEALARECGGDDPALVDFCREAALALQAAQAGVGLLSAWGTQVPGSATTLGKRFGGMPRFSGSLRAGLVHADLPDVREVGSSPLDANGFVGLGVQGSLALGVFDGFSVLPTVGGILSLDVLGAAGMLLLPEGDGFRSDPRFWGAGARLGILRESFTIPGVTVSVAWRKLSETRLGDLQGGDPVQVDFDPSVTSVRGVVGKDLLALAVLAGVGWDRYSSDGTLTASRFGEPGQGQGSASFDGFESDRVLFFGGVGLNLLLLQLSAEGGWARGFDAPAGRPAGGYDPGSTSLFLSVAARLTL